MLNKPADLNTVQTKLLSGIELREYQRQCLAQMLHVFQTMQNDLLLDMPTGSGKTLLLQCAAAKLIASGVFEHIVIVAPQKQIESGFIPTAKLDVHLPNESILVLPSVFTKLTASGRSKSIGLYLRSPNLRKNIVVCTHQTVTQWNEVNLPQDLSKALLIVDEAHHSGADGLSRIIDFWQEGNGRLLLATATPFRSDNRPILTQGMVCIRRSLAQHLEENTSPLAPKRVQNEIVAVKLATEDIAESELTGIDIRSENIDRFADAIAANWSADTRRKIIVRVPVTRLKTKPIVDAISQRLRGLGAKVFDATGVGIDVQKSVIDFLNAERKLPYSETCDVVIGSQRVVEGTDWPPCTDVFVLGMPSSQTIIVQLLGRATREKPTGCPVDLANRAKITFFVPCESELQFHKFRMAHSRNAILLSAFLAHTRLPGNLEIGSLVKAGISRYLPKNSANSRDDQNRTADDDANANSDNTSFQTANDIRNAVDRTFPDFDEDHSLALQVLAGICATDDQLGKNHKQAIASAMESPLLAHLDSDERTRILQAVVTRLLASTPNSENVAKKIATKLGSFLSGKKTPTTNEINAALALAISEVLEEFRDKTIANSELLQNYIGQMHSLTGGDFSTYSKLIQDKMAEIQKRPIAIRDLHDEIWKFHNDHGDWPNTGSGYCDRFETTWVNLNQYLQVGTRGFPSGSTLFIECNKVAVLHGLEPEAPIRLEKLTEEIVLDAIRRFFAKHGVLPTKTSGKVEVGIEAVDGNTWSSIAFYCRSGKRMVDRERCRSFRELKNVVLQEQGVRESISNLEIREVILGYWKQNGEFPTKNCKAETKLGFTFAQLAEFVVHGKRGTTKSTWTDQINAVKSTLGESFIAKDAVWSHDSIKHQIRLHFESTNELPTLKTKIPSKNQGTWAAIHRNLVEGKYGMPKGTKLADLVNLVRNEMGIAPSDLESDHFYSRKDAAKILGIGETTLRRWVALGKLTCAKRIQGVYLFEKSYIDELATKKRKLQ